MTARFDRAWAKASRANLAGAVGLLTLPASRSASAAQATPEQRVVYAGRLPLLFRRHPQRAPDPPKFHIGPKGNIIPAPR